MDNFSNEQQINEIEVKFFDLINKDDEYSINKILSSDMLYQIWDYRNKENDNSSVIHMSALKNNYSITKLIIEYIQKYNQKILLTIINLKNNLGVTALHYASFKGNVSILKLLLCNGADETIITESNLNIIHYCVQGNKPNCLMYYYFRFLEKEKEGKNDLMKLITDPDKDGSTPLHWAAYCGKEEILLYIINLKIFQNAEEKQKYIDKNNSHGYTALHLGVISNSYRIVLKLLQNGANTDIKDNLGNTPYQLAKEKKYNEIANIIKNNKSCQLFNFRTPVKKYKKSTKNILFIFILQLFSSSIMYLSTMRIAISFVGYDSLVYILFFSYSIFLIFFFVIYFLLLCLDPGVIPANNDAFLNGLIEQNKDLTNYCYKCFVKKERNNKHCVICHKCYKDFDHHCFWINKCVAKNNYNLFIIFLFECFIYLCITFLISILGLIKIISIKFEINEENIKNIIYPEEMISKYIFKEQLKYVHFGLNIFLMLLTLFFLIQEGILIFLHCNLAFSNKKIKKTYINSGTDISSEIGDILVNSFEE